MDLVESPTKKRRTASNQDVNALEWPNSLVLVPGRDHPKYGFPLYETNGNNKAEILLDTHSPAYLFACESISNLSSDPIQREDREEMAKTQGFCIPDLIHNKVHFSTTSFSKK